MVKKNMQAVPSLEWIKYERFSQYEILPVRNFFLKEEILDFPPIIHFVWYAFFWQTELNIDNS